MVDESEVSKEEELYHYRGEYEVKLSSDLYLEVMKEPKPPTINTDLVLLDSFIGGVELGELVLLSGWTGGGKTTFARTLTRNFHKSNIMTCWFQFEETYRQFFEKFRAENLKSLPVFVLPKKMQPQAMDWFEERVREAIIKYRVKVVFIDHLHRLLDYELKNNSLLRTGSSNVSMFVGANVMNIKRIAVKYNIAIVLIAHTSKTKGEKETDSLGLGSVRDSSFIEQESDTVLYVWRGKKPGTANLKIAKDRKNGTASQVIWLLHNAMTKNFTESENQPGGITTRERF